MTRRKKQAKLTESQIVLSLHLKELGISTIPEYQFCDRKWRFDLAAPNERLAFECNGHWQGQHGAGWSEGAEKINTAQMLGWRVLVFHNKDVRSGKAKEWLKQYI
jgi:very-short-patch-repair endonuclease